MKLLVVIVNYRTAALTLDCLETLAREVVTVPGTRVVVTDCSSGDDSLAKIGAAIETRGWSAWATLMPLNRNGGFAWGNNQAIEPALKGDDKPQYVYLLNPDTIVLPDALKALVSFMDSHPEVGIGGGRSVRQDGSTIISAFRFHTVLSELETALRLGVVTKVLKDKIVAPPPSEEPAKCDWVAGASMIVRREVFEKIGLLDDRYFMYYEETDFCLRAARAGWPTWYVPASKIIHLVGSASGVTGASRVAKRRPRYWFDSRHRYFRQNYGAAKTLAADGLWACGFAVHSVLRRLRGKPRTDPPWLLWDFCRYNLMSWAHRR
jgi:N-acetylglucosaminyl-diphospho-decaprenol L-rhamnosyltransferase